jgi:hypothetical protein
MFRLVQVREVLPFSDMARLRPAFLGSVLIPVAILGCGGSDEVEKSADHNPPKVRVGGGKIQTDNLRESVARHRAALERQP